MPTDAVLDQFEAILAPHALSFSRPEANRSDALVSPEQFHAAVEALVSAKWGYLAAITGLDLPAGPANPAGGAVAGLYQFCEGAAVGTVRVEVPYSAARLPTICDLIPSATLYEREFGEMFGVELEGTPDNSRLLLADDWPEGVYPLRKSFTTLDAIGAAQKEQGNEG